MERHEQYINKVLNDKYLIKELIGIGGMAYVFKAEVVGTGELVAVKILSEEFSDDEKSVKRFINESKAVSMLSHPNIVKIYDVSFGKINYIVMEYVDGVTLKDYIDHKKILSCKEAIYYTCQILSALSHAHSKNIIHRDVKPQNIMLQRDGSIKVMDFGIAKMLNSESITMTDKAIGTVNYISPEQASGKEVGYSSDIYSVGVMLYEMTTGVLPFVADGPMAVAMMQVTDDPVPPREHNEEIPKGLEQVILKSMHKETDDRFSSCAAMGRALELLQNDPTTVFVEHKQARTAGRRRQEETKKSSFLSVVSGVTLSFFLVALVSLIVFGIKFLNSGRVTDMGTEIAIPELVGSVYSDELIADLESRKIRVISVKGETNQEMAVDTILKQTPEGGKTYKLPNGSDYYDITLTVSAGAGKIALEDYSLTEIRRTRDELENLGIEIIEITQYSNTVMEDYIISTSPGPGTVVDVGSTITLYISKGVQVKNVTVPEIVGSDIDDAKRALIAKKIRIGEITYENSTEPAGTVISSSLTAGESVKEAVTKVDIVVSNGVSPITDNPDVSTDVLEDENPGDGDSAPENTDTPDTENTDIENIDNTEETEPEEIPDGENASAV